MHYLYVPPNFRSENFFTYALPCLPPPPPPPNLSSHNLPLAWASTAMNPAATPDSPLSNDRPGAEEEPASDSETSSNSCPSECYELQAFQEWDAGEQTHRVALLIFEHDHKMSQPHDMTGLILQRIRAFRHVPSPLRKEVVFVHGRLVAGWKGLKRRVIMKRFLEVMGGGKSKKML
ncbi:hypothetical protein SNOG_08033 [Parastagonospora nodorum SN15]|uniref:Uncharacterized protein n=1 Tax=Phaeosphaeria nodorum (strain SN15 / ATCC MYA-4574 / FGSC 10173) TaxID=321614 RepID=Q0UJN1_PHANO|nr:hypothetical protein SNOG_08033 [Parastagonospora nodorum SN15]EAT84309.1 hypothetical protein SNOG_08033 [Parastagonospora nodorum SN15]